MDTKHLGGIYNNNSNKAFLHDSRSSAFPETEKEYLLGYANWKVTSIGEETLEYVGQEFKATVINLR